MSAYDFSNVSSADLLRLEWADEEERKRAANRVNTFAELMGQRGDWSPTSGSDGVAALTAYSKSRDLEHLQQAQKMMSSAIGTPALPYNDPDKFNTWYKTAQIPYRFVKDLRASYKNVSDQFRASEKHPGEMTLQEQQIEAGKYAVTLQLGAKTLQELKIEQDRLGIKKTEAELRQGKTRERKEGNFIVTEDWRVTPRHPKGRWFFKSKAPRWESNEGAIRELKKDDKFIVEIKKGGKWVEYNTADRWAPATVPKEIKLVNEYIRLLEASGETVGPARRAQLFRDYGLVDQSVTRPAFTTAMITEFNNKKTAFANSTGTMKRMLEQLSDPEVTVGNVRSLFTGIENIGSQFRQFAQQFQEDHLVDPRQYAFNTAEKGSQLALNITGLAYALAKQEEGNRLTDADVQKRIDMISGRAGGSPMSKDMMTANLIEIFNYSVRGIKNEYQNALEAELPGTTLYATPEEFLDSREAGELVIEPQIKGGKPTGVMGLGYYDSKGEFQVLQWWSQ